MKVADIVKFGLLIIVGLVALAVVSKILSVITSGWFIVAVFAIWWFGFRNKSSQ